MSYDYEWSNSKKTLIVRDPSFQEIQDKIKSLEAIEEKDADAIEELAKLNAEIDVSLKGIESDLYEKFKKIDIKLDCGFSGNHHLTLFSGYS